MFKRFVKWWSNRTVVSIVAEVEPKVSTTQTQFTRMTSEVYTDFAKRFPGPAKPNDAFEAGYLLGVQMVLQRLREGYVIGQQ